jgi:hypothetical protein
VIRSGIGAFESIIEDDEEAVKGSGETERESEVESRETLLKARVQIRNACIAGARACDKSL